VAARAQERLAARHHRDRHRVRVPDRRPRRHRDRLQPAGVARYLVDAIQLRDYPVVQNLTMFIAVVVVLANLAVDLLYAWADPRIKYEKA